MRKWQVAFMDNEHLITIGGCFAFYEYFFDVIFDIIIDKISSKGSIKELGDMNVAIC